MLPMLDPPARARCLDIAHRHSAGDAGDRSGAAAAASAAAAAAARAAAAAVSAGSEARRGPAMLGEVSARAAYSFASCLCCQEKKFDRVPQAPMLIFCVRFGVGGGFRQDSDLRDGRQVGVKKRCGSFRCLS